MSIERTMDDVLETVRKAKDRQKKCCLLIGAGCSVEAGIPLASGFVKAIQEEWPAAYKRAGSSKQYPQCMAELALSERRDLIAKYVDNAKINWGHIAIAQLMKHGYVDRVLTTNFDPLVVRACAMVGHYPAVYDFAASQVLKPADIHGEAVFHLHGQRTGFVLMNTDDECKTHSDLLAPLFQDAGQGRVWIVVGYSGENDPVFKHLARVESFDHNLYWIGFKDREPAEHVRNELLTNGKYAFFVKRFDADGFFVSLAQRLKCFPPQFVSEPFSHLDAFFEKLTNYKDPHQSEACDIMDKTRQMIRGASRKYEKPAKSSMGRAAKTATVETQILNAYMAGDYEKVTELAASQESTSTDLVYYVSWAYVSLGNALADQAEDMTGADADTLFDLASQNYEAALRIKPDMHEALSNWGITLTDQAKQKTGVEADALFSLAGEKYKEALRIKPDKSEALHNWGIALSDLAKQKSGAEADTLFALASEKFEAALQIEPNRHQTLDTWSAALLDHAKLKSGAEAERLFAESAEKCHRAGELAPGCGAYNLACGCALQQKERECHAWLQQAKDLRTLPSRQHVLEDSDLAGVRDTEWFQALMKDHS